VWDVSIASPLRGTVVTEQTAIRIVGVSLERFEPAATAPDGLTGDKTATGDGDEQR
jgi:hypothetical protein